MGYQKILVTLDGSGLAELALQSIPEVAEPGASIHILSVVDYAVVESAGEVATLYSTMNAPGMFSGLQQPAFQSIGGPQAINARFDYLRDVSYWLKERGYHVTIEARPGEVVDTIIEVAQDEGFDLLIMATHGRTGLRRVLLGSVAEGVLRRAPCPVLLVPVRE